MNKYLVLHDYGMGALWWWVWASSPEEIVETVAEVEVVDESELDGSGDDLEEVRLDDLPEGELADLRDQRAAQRGRPGYGVLTGRDRVYLRDDDPEYEGTVFLAEVGPDGRQLRQVEQSPDGTAVRTDDFTGDAPVDLRDPVYAEKELTAEEFERAWAVAVPEVDS